MPACVNAIRPEVQLETSTLVLSEQAYAIANEALAFLAAGDKVKAGERLDEVASITSRLADFHRDTGALKSARMWAEVAQILGTTADRVNGRPPSLESMPVVGHA